MSPGRVAEYVSFMANQYLSEWLDSPQGRYLLAWEQACFDRRVADVFGYNALQVGLPEFDFLASSRIARHFACASRGPAQVINKTYALPFASSSLDLVILPHVLEFASHPHQVLREVERVLVSDGRVLISGFNPFSLWGMRRLLARSGSAYPWRGHYLSVPRLRDWLALLGFETAPADYGCYRPAVAGSDWLERWRFMDRMGARWWPVCGGAYVLQAVKRVHGMRLITPKWRERLTADKRLAGVASGGQRVAGRFQHRRADRHGAGSANEQTWK